MITDSRTHAQVAGTWTCKNAAGTTVTCDSNGANATSASFTPTTPMTASHEYLIWGVLDSIYDTSGNAMSPLDFFVDTKAD